MGHYKTMFSFVTIIFDHVFVKVVGYGHIFGCVEASKPDIF